MGAFWAVCDCGRSYMWFSHTARDVARAKKCDKCWEQQGVIWDEKQVIEFKPIDKP
jgi:hypothetical protein